MKADFMEKRIRQGENESRFYGIKNQTKGK